MIIAYGLYVSVELRMQQQKIANICSHASSQRVSKYSSVVSLIMWLLVHVS